MGKWLLAIMMHALLNGSILTVWALLLHLRVNGTAEIVFKNNYCFIIMVGMVTIALQKFILSLKHCFTQNSFFYRRCSYFQSHPIDRNAGKDDYSYVVRR